MAMPTTTTLIMFETVLDSVEVNARWAPMTSLLSRDTSAPVWVRVKNASDIRCTCANTEVRRSKISPSPMREESQPIASARPASRSATPAAASASMTTRRVSCFRMPSSTILLTSSGVTTTRAASTTVRPRNTPIGRRCGRANPSTRRTVSPWSFCSPMLRSVRMCRHTGPIPCPMDICAPPSPSAPPRGPHSPISDASSRKRRTCASRSASRCSSRSRCDALCSSALVALTAP
jgi:hypothetical protein